eukprot:TRINITY_DN1800_c0_g1_i1.p1 TRINITY_DN1800_c0_g1~~TRINITY_DN1800_c0_g1_i1.p1  ORF type:complete len:200 (-),score=6.11 TRINITY_DN1800_c0_g1_i1:58-657(-)
MVVEKDFLFCSKLLDEYFSEGRVKRGSGYDELGWVFNISCSASKEDIVLTAKVHHSREQTSAAPVMLRIPVGAQSLADVSGRCACYKGDSGQCGHLLGLFLAGWRLVDEDGYKRRFGKNRDGRNRLITSIELSAKLSAVSAKEGKACTTSSGLFHEEYLREGAHFACTTAGADALRGESALSKEVGDSRSEEICRCHGR